MQDADLRGGSSVSRNAEDAALARRNVTLFGNACDHNYRIRLIDRLTLYRPPGRPARTGGPGFSYRQNRPASYAYMKLLWHIVISEI